MGLIAALAVAFATPGAALAQKAKAKDGKEAAGAVTESSRKKGMAEAPKAVATAGLACTVADARWIGGTPENKTAKTPARDFYEVACQGGSGFVVGLNKDGTGADVNTCIETAGGTVACMLPANANATAGLAPALVKAGVLCTPEKTRGIGQTSQNSYIEVSCAEGGGYILEGSKPLDLSKGLKPNNCLGYDANPGQLKCTLAEPAARLAVIDRFVTDAKVTCTVKDRRYIGVFKSGGEGFEVSCTDGKGYVLTRAPTGAVTSQECAKTPGLCDLSDARQAMTEQSALYTRLAKEAGGNCDVEKYALFPTQGRQEVLELTCKDGKSVVGIFPVGAKGQILDCGRAMIAGYKCSPGKAKWDPLTADLRKLGKADCVVSDVALRGKSQSGDPQIEVACADGLPGYLVRYTNPTTPADALGCRLTACVLPPNRPKS